MGDWIAPLILLGFAFACFGPRSAGCPAPAADQVPLNQRVIPMSEQGPRGFSGEELVESAQRRFGQFHTDDLNRRAYILEFQGVQARAWEISWEGQKWLRVNVPIEIVDESDGARTQVLGRLVSPGLHAGAFLQAKACVREDEGGRRQTRVEFYHSVEAEFLDGLEPVLRQDFTVFSRKGVVLGSRTWVVPDTDAIQPRR